MQSFTGVEFDSKPNEINIYKTAVDVVTSCIETEKTDEQTGDTKVVYVCDVERYTLLEYIYVQQSKYDAVQTELTQTQVGLIEVYELLLGGEI